MNKGLVALISALAGAAAGAGGMYMYMKDKCDKRIEEEVAAYKRSHGSVKAKVQKLIDDPKPEVHDPLNKSHSSIDGGPVSLDNHRTNYAAMSENYHKSAEDILAESESPEEDEPEVEDGPTMRVELITAEQYNQADEDVTDLIWYPDDNDILEDEYGEEIEERERLIGDWLEHIDRSELPQMEDESGLIYIRNNDLHIIYAVEVVNGTRNGGVSEE